MLSTIANSIDVLASATKKGFDEVNGKLDSFKDEMYEFKKETGATLFNINSKLETVDKRLDKWE